MSIPPAAVLLPDSAVAAPPGARASMGAKPLPLVQEVPYSMIVIRVKPLNYFKMKTSSEMKTLCLNNIRWLKVK